MCVLTRRDTQAALQELVHDEQEVRKNAVAAAAAAMAFIELALLP
jgi:hypothetical protein